METYQEFTDQTYSNSSNEYTNSEYTNNEYNNYSTSEYTNQYTTNTATQSQGYTEEEYLELEAQKTDLQNEIEDLESQRNTFRITTILFGLLFAICFGYIIISEVSEPLFGKWPEIAKENAKLQTQVTELGMAQLTMDSLVSVNNILSEQSGEQNGVFFEVQIGAFENFNMEAYMEQLAKLKKEKVDIMDKYTLGKFRDYKMAEAFSKDIKKMGIDGAFIVGKVDGQRVDIQEAIKTSKKAF